MSIFRAKTAVAAGVTGLLAAVLAAAPATADPAGAPSPCGTGGTFTTSPPTCTYTAVGTDTFTVPEGVSAVTVDVFGAEGGSAAGFVTPNPPNEGASGGLGGETRAGLAVSAGQNLQITVGGAGSSGSSRRGEYARPGGTGHGAGGGGAHGGGGSGGGATDVRTGAFGPTDRILVAGGGGGAGNGGPLLRGGNGGGPAGEPGGQGGGPEGSGAGGGGATQTAHGTGSRTSPLGGPGIPGGDVDPNTGLPNPGSGGAGGNGARGGNGGGGGGGYFGGGGGSGGGNPDNLYGAGGGGGSGFAAPAATDAVLLPGVNRGNGKAVVSFRYGSSLTVATDTDAPLFGHPVTLTATAAPAHPAAGTPGGTVTFFDGTTALATVPLDGGQARLRTAALRPGSHAITATYGGDARHAPSATAGPAPVSVGFSLPCITTARVGTLTVGAGQALCIAAGGSQTGPVKVAPGGSLAITDARVTGPVSAEGALALAFCGSRLTGPVSVTDSVGYVLAGSEDGPTACAGNTFQGPLTFEGNTGGLQASANAVTGPVRIDGNSGDGPLPGADVPAFRANRVTGPLRCGGNAPELVQTGTVVQGPRSGQCRPAP
ncbi:Ig-like domain-containing protein [Streptomyces sp. NBC_01214]|uniref:Ig-like domain-containing protein n=1 Tax=Streptomyces sp. NBC_01214 TaxID=2903777 RepID=UPI00224DB94F|nr:Ig-like domain-containing protein [Streptomyces sp. NBC_01214]MCX4807257.1 Ig-like domain-containing protein [Streptomyces sp. NBC_01214]